MRRLRHCLLSAVLILTACAGGPQPTPAPRLIPPAYLVEIPPPPGPETGDLQGLYSNHIEAMRLYWLLRDRYQGLVDWLQATGKVGE